MDNLFKNNKCIVSYVKTTVMYYIFIMLYYLFIYLGFIMFSSNFMSGRAFDLDVTCLYN